MDADRWERKRQRREGRWARRHERWERRNERWNHSGHLFSGIVVFSIGVLFLLGNMGYVDVRNVFQFWPLIFIALGVTRVVASGYDHFDGNGVFWIIFGC